MSFWVYILTDSNNKTLYIGVTNDIQRRTEEHKQELIEGFTKRYKLKKLIYAEEYHEAMDAITREKQLKKWHRQWKLDLIKSLNPTFNDLSLEL